MDIYQWFDAICNDLDPAGQYQRPAVDFDAWWFAAGAGYCPTDNIVLLYDATIKKHGGDIYHVIAHELRHWYQHQSSILQDFSVFVSDGEAILFCGVWWGNNVEMLVCDNETYRQLPWEKDANDYADYAITNLLPARATA